jgi:hypothetical protein
VFFQKYKNENGVQYMDNSFFKSKLRSILFSSGVPGDKVDAAADVFAKRFKHLFGDSYGAVNDSGEMLMNRFNETIGIEEYISELRSGNIPGSDAERKFFAGDLMSNAIRSASIGGEHTRERSKPVDMNQLLRDKAGFRDAPKQPEKNKPGDKVNKIIRTVSGHE